MGLKGIRVGLTEPLRGKGQRRHMSVTKLQRVVLQRYLGYRTKPPTFFGLLRQSWRVEVILIAASALGVWYAYSVHLYGTSCFIGGLLVGALARDAGTFRRVLQAWPALSQVLDWQRVERVLDEEKAD